MIKNNKLLQIIGIYICTALLGFILSDGVGFLYSSFFNVQCANSLFIAMNFDNGCWLEGFIYSYCVILSLTLIAYLKSKKAMYYFFLGISPFFILSLFVGDYINVIFYFSLSAVCFFLGSMANKVKLASRK